MRLSLLITTFFCLLFSFNIKATAACRNVGVIPKDLLGAKVFLTDAIYALHIQYVNENFNSPEAIKARSKIFDTVFNTPYWNTRLNNSQASNILWNWVRLQYWGALNQQALLKEEQGFKTSSDKNLVHDFNKIYRFPIYPYVSNVRNYRCDKKDSAYYPCGDNIKAFSVILSPKLACSDPNLESSLTFEYLVVNSSHGWRVLDIKLKGFKMIESTFAGYEDLSNKYGTKKALSHFQRFISSTNLVAPNAEQPHSGSAAFDRTFRIRAPKYPLVY